MKNTKMVANYNKSVIMKRAWKFFKAQDIRTMEMFSTCLRQSWNIAKNGTKENEIGEIYTKYNKQIFYFILPRVGGKTEVAEELTNDVFIKCKKHLENYDVNVAKLNTWLHFIAKNIVIDHHRTAHADRYFNTDDYVDESGKPMFEQQASTQTDDNITSEETRKKIADAFRSLSAKQKKIATMYFLRELNHEEICVALNIPLGTVKATINRCRAKLREQLQSLRQTA